LNDQYYLMSKGKINGPFAMAHLQKLARRGVVLASDQISSDRRTWAPATQFAGLFSGTSAAATTPPLSFAPPSFPPAVPPTAAPAAPAATRQAPPASPAKVQTIGRDPSCDLVLDMPAVSPRHLTLNITAAGVFATDLGSSGGTYVNGARLNAPRRLVEGDAVSLGGVPLSFNGRSLVRPTTDQGFAISVSHLGREVPDQGTGKPRMLIRDVTMTIKPGEFIALVGASGAGKSTLFGALSGRVRATHGQVLYDGNDLYANFDALRGYIGYVPQRDVFHDALPVIDALLATSRLRLSRDNSADDMEANIDRVLKIVSLTEKRNTVISKLSGGEQKRVAIALELLSRPRVLFLDEPTAPLDPRTTTQMLSLFRELADRGITVIMITHAASSLATCDVVVYMHKGLLTFQGPPDQMTGFFGVSDIGKAYDAELGKTPEQWQEQFRASADGQAFIMSRAAPPVRSAAPAAPAAVAQRRGADWGAMWNQLRVLTWRYFRVMTVDKRNLIVLLALAPLVAAMLCLVTSSIESTSKDDLNYFKQQKILCFGSVMIVMFLALFASVREIVKELPIYLHEHFVNVEILPYLLSKVIVLLGIDAAQTALVAVVIHYYGHIEAGTPALQFGILYLCSVVGTLIGLMISAMVTQSDAAVTGMIIIVIPEILFSSALIDVSGISKLLAAPLITTFWGFNALMSKLHSRWDDVEHTKPLPSALMMVGQLIVVAALTYWLMVRKDGPGASERIAEQLKRSLAVRKRKGR
jgi:ABC-type multidrug transport system ATPase subunit